MTRRVDFGRADSAAGQMALAHGDPPGICCDLRHLFKGRGSVALFTVYRRQNCRAHKCCGRRGHRTGSHAATALDAVFQALQLIYALGCAPICRFFTLPQTLPLWVQLTKEIRHIHCQVTQAGMVFKGGQGYRRALQVGNACGAGQGRVAVDGTGAGAAGGVVAAMAVHQCGILIQADLFQSVQYCHVGYQWHRKVLRSRWIDPAGFVSHYLEYDRRWFQGVKSIRVWFA